LKTNNRKTLPVQSGTTIDKYEKTSNRNFGGLDACLMQ
jgi:hypothetical protein